MLTAMGLALGIDYSLFVVSRYREERAAGARGSDAIAAAGATASRAVLFSGATFVVAMSGMLLVPSNVMRSLAVGAIAVGIASVLAALTLLPGAARRCSATASTRCGVPWSGARRPTQRREPLLGRDRPSASCAGPSISLVAVDGPARSPRRCPVLGLHLGASGVSTLPERLPRKQGFEALAREFPRQSSSPVADRRRRATSTRRGARGASPGCGRDSRPNRAFGGRATCASRRTASSRAISTPVAGDKTGDRGPERRQRTCAPSTFRRHSPATRRPRARRRRHGRQRRLHRRHERTGCRSSSSSCSASASCC